MVKLIAILVLLGTFSFTAKSQLVLNWNIQHPQTKKWIPLGEKGSVQEALIKSNYLPDPFVGSNEKLFQWIENEDWTFEAVFKLDSIQKNYQYDLDFPSIDTYAKVFINGKLCGTGENSFVHYRFSVAPYLKKGKNTVKVIFQSPIKAKKEEASAFVYPAPNDVGAVKVAPYCRKPQYQFGWDWSLRMTTMGFWEKVSLVSYKENRVIEKGINTRQLSDTSYQQTFILFLRDETQDATYTWESKLFGSKQLPLLYGKLVRDDIMQSPELWWPRGQGKQHLYQDIWTLKAADGRIIYQDTIQFGVRTSELVQEKDEWGTSFVFKINGRRVFCKGADYIPEDIFPATITDEKLRNSVRAMAESNFNMVRVWGGGMYAKEAFLEECDKLGIMVWHDFMFACAMYPGNEAFLKNVKQELSQNIPRIAAHPSLVYFNGNNEVDVAWKNWGFQQQYNISEEHQKIIQADYDKLFKGLIPECIHRFTNIPYEHTSPLSNWGKDEFYNHGTQHYWGVWHGKDPMSDMTKKIGRFNAEYGFQSFPEYSTLNQFSDTSEWSLFSNTMKNHQKSYVGNSMIAKHSDSLYGKANNFSEFVYLSQLTQAEAVESAVIAHRLDAPRCSGTLFWQFNDCWPSISWSSIDYYGNWKALQYKAKAAYEDVVIVKKPASKEYLLISDSPEMFSSNLTCIVYDLKGIQLGSYQCKKVVTIGNFPVFQKELEAFKDSNCYISFTWTNASGKMSYLNEIQSIDIKKSTKQPTIIILSTKIGKGKGLISITNEEAVNDLWIASKELGIHFEYNFLDLLPGTSILKFTYSENPPKKEDFILNWR